MVSSVLLGCQDSSGEVNDKKNKLENNVNNEEMNESEENNVSDVNIYDFENIGKAPEAKEPHEVNNVIKVFFSESTFDDSVEPIAINLQDNEIYQNPSLSLHSISSYDESIELNDVEEVLDILKAYDVQNWKKDYTFEDPDTYEDGFIWRLWLQYEDGTVEKHKGKGTDRTKITPDNFDGFIKELNSFANKHLKDD